MAKGKVSFPKSQK